MNGNHKYELSEMHPRKPPERFSYQNYARIQPMVPEPSLIANYEPYIPKENDNSNDLKLARQPFQELSGIEGRNIEIPLQNDLSNFQYNSNMKKIEKARNYHDSASKLTHRKLPEAFDKKKTIDHDLSVSMYSKIVGKENSQNIPLIPQSRNIPEKENQQLASNNAEHKVTYNHAEVTIPTEFLDALRSQSQEISRLNKTVEDLTNKLLASNSNPVNQKEDNVHMTNEPKILMSDASTQTSAPPSPKIIGEGSLNYMAQQLNSSSACLFPVEVTQKDNNCETNHNFPDELRNAVPIIVNDMETAPPRLTSFDSNEVYKNVDMYNDNVRAKKVSNPINQNYDIIDVSKEVKCVDLCPPVDIRKNINDFNNIPQDTHSRPSAPNDPIQINDPTVLQRMRQLDISFLTADDFNRKEPKSPKHPNTDDYSRMWWPKAVPFSAPSYSQFTSKESMIQNSTALKHLTDEQLTKLAKHRIPDRENCNYTPKTNLGHNEFMRPSELTEYGISERNLSQSTIQYLEKNRLTK